MALAAAEVIDDDVLETSLLDTCSSISMATPRGDAHELVGGRLGVHFRDQLETPLGMRVAVLACMLCMAWWCHVAVAMTATPIQAILGGAWRETVAAGFGNELIQQVSHVTSRPRDRVSIRVYNTLRLMF